MNIFGYLQNIKPNSECINLFLKYEYKLTCYINSMKVYQYIDIINNFNNHNRKNKHKVNDIKSFKVIINNIKHLKSIIKQNIKNKGVTFVCIEAYLHTLELALEKRT